MNFDTNLFSGMVTYQLQPKKPSLDFSRTEQQLLAGPLLQPAWRLAYVELKLSNELVARATSAMAAAPETFEFEARSRS